MRKNFSNFPQQISMANTIFPSGLFGGAGVSITLASGLTILLGPNGSGKTKIMAGIRDALRQEYGPSFVRFISAGRMGILEDYRSNVQGNTPNPDNTHVGNFSLLANRKASESVTGDFLALMQRSDLKLKVESRLQGLFNRTLKLSWTQNGLKVDFQSLDTGATSYGAGSEASGLTQLVAMLAAIYDDDIKSLVIDEPEVSLHPQLQSYLLKEMLTVAGNPDVAGKKCIIISTHSPSMLALKSIDDLPSIVFFRESNQPPVQINNTSPVMLDPSLNSVIIRISDGYKIAMFANNVLLSEGISDEIVINALAELKKANFSSTGVQVVPVSGKGDLKTADFLFSTIGKKTYMLADLDVLDDNSLCAYLDQSKNVSTTGFANLVDQFTDMRSAMNSLLTSNWPDISAQAATQRYWTGGNSPGKERSVLSYIANNTNATIAGLNNSALWAAFQVKLSALLQVMDEYGLVLNRKGTIENSYLNPAIPASASKPQAASLEAAYLTQNNPAAIDISYADILRVINKIKRLPKVDESALLREKLGSILGAIEAIPTSSFNDEIIARTINKVDPDVSSIFEIKRRTSPGNPGLEISVVSRLFDSFGASFEHELGTPLNLATKLPSD